MHSNPAFRQDGTDRHLAFARNRAFGTLVVAGDDGPVLSHVPFLLSEAGDSADLHLVRSNPIARMGFADAVIAVAGPDGYISPDWYGIDDQVPTWNYVAGHLRGRLERQPQEGLRDLLARQSAAFEARLAPKPEWTLDKMSEDALGRLLRMIVPFRMTIADVQGTWKLNQNKDSAVRLDAAGSVVDGGIGQELSALAEMMRLANS